MLLRLEGQQRHLSDAIVGEFDVERTGGIRHVIDVLPNFRVVIGGHRFVEMARLDGSDDSDNASGIISEIGRTQQR